MQFFKNRKNLYKFLAVLLILVALFSLLFYFAEPLVKLLSDRQKTEQLIDDAGPFGPLIFIGLQVLQIVFAPIPGQVVGLIGGFLFGSFLGSVYAILGSLIGFSLIFWVSRKLGRPFVEKVIDQKTLKKFDYLAGTKGKLVLFLIFLLPGFPDDLICYLAGLTKISIKGLILISLLGRLPSIVLLSIAGNSASEANYVLLIMLSIVFALIVMLGYWKRKQIEAFVKRFSD